jgi:hypothetical protein
MKTTSAFGTYPTMITYKRLAQCLEKGIVTIENEKQIPEEAQKKIKALREEIRKRPVKQTGRL